MELFECLTRLNAAHGPSGDEAEVRAVLETLSRPFGGETSTDPLGNLIVHCPGPGPKVLLAAHMDSIGFIVTHIEKEGFLRLGPLGGVEPLDLLYSSLRLKNGVRGVLAKEEKTKADKLKLDACYLDIGAKDSSEARSLCRVGDTAVFDSDAFLRGDKIVSPYLDNRLSCAVLLRVLEQMGSHENDLYFVFTAQEEVGLRGAGCAAYGIEPDYAVVVDVTDVEDTPESEKSGTCRLGQGAAVKVADADLLCHPRMIALLEELAGREEIPVQRDIMTGGGTDGGAIHLSRVGVYTGGVSIPCRYVHTPREMASLTDAENCARLLLAFVREPLVPLSEL